MDPSLVDIWFHKVAQHKGTSGAVVKVAYYIAVLVKTRCDICVTDIERRFGLARKTTQRCMQQLEHLGYLRRAGVVQRPIDCTVPGRRPFGGTMTIGDWRLLLDGEEIAASAHRRATLAGQQLALPEALVGTWLRAVMNDRRLPAGASRLAYFMADHFRSGTPLTYAGLAREFRLDRRRTQEQAGFLIHCGHLRIVGERQVVACTSQGLRLTRAHDLRPVIAGHVVDLEMVAVPETLAADAMEAA